MSWLKGLGLTGPAHTSAPETGVVEERRAEERRLVFHEAVLVLSDFDRMRAIIKNVSARGVGIQYSDRRDLPFRVRLISPTLNLNCWARVVWQDDGSAGLELQEPATS